MSSIEGDKAQQSYGRLSTEPNLTEDYGTNRDYFKRPLKLLKKKLRENKKNTSMSTKIHHNDISDSMIKAQLDQELGYQDKNTQSVTKE